MPTTLVLVMDALPKRIRQKIAALELTYRKADAQCDLPQGSLSNIVYGKWARPSPEILLKISRGLGISYRELALLAYGIIGENDYDPGPPDDTPPFADGSPPESDSAWSPAGQKRQKVSAST
jgi:hypothetical protein